MSESDKFEAYARECIRLAWLSEDRENRERLLEMARMWMMEIMNEEGHSANLAPPPPSYVPSEHR